MRTIKEIKQVYKEMIEEILNETKNKEEEIRKKLVNIENEISKLNDTTVKDYLENLRKENPDTDSTFPLRRKMWKVFWNTDTISVLIDIEFKSKELFDKYSSLTINNKLLMAYQNDYPYKLHFSISDAQESRFRKELNEKLLFKAGTDVKGISVIYKHVDADPRRQNFD